MLLKNKTTIEHDLSYAGFKVRFAHCRPCEKEGIYCLGWNRYGTVLRTMCYGDVDEAFGRIRAMIDEL